MITMEYAQHANHLVLTAQQQKFVLVASQGFEQHQLVSVMKLTMITIEHAKLAHTLV